MTLHLDLVCGRERWFKIWVEYTVATNNRFCLFLQVIRGSADDSTSVLLKDILTQRKSFFHFYFSIAKMVSKYLPSRLYAQNKRHFYIKRNLAMAFMLCALQMNHF